MVGSKEKELRRSGPGGTGVVLGHYLKEQSAQLESWPQIS